MVCSGSSLLKGKSGLMEGCGPAFPRGCSSLGKMNPTLAEGRCLLFQACSAFWKARAASLKRTGLHFKENAHLIKGNLYRLSKGDARPFFIQDMFSQCSLCARRCFRRWSATVIKTPLHFVGRGLGMLLNTPQCSGQAPQHWSALHLNSAEVGKP